VAGKIPVVILVKDGAVIPHIALAQSTAQMDWSKLDLVVYAKGSQRAEGLVCLPSDKVLHRIFLVRRDNTFVLETDPFAGKVSWKVRMLEE
jgi:alpha-D-xyloside xylohydrolase